MACRRFRSSVLVAIIALLFAPDAMQPARAADCNLKKAVEQHQRFDNLLEAKFEHYWYGTETSPSLRTIPLDDIIEELPRRTAILFYDISAGSLCVSLIDRDRHVIEAQTPMESPDGGAVRAIAGDVRKSLTGDDDTRGWRGPEHAKLFLPTTGAGTETAGAALARASRLVLPPPIRQAIQSRAYDRLLIVPALNLGDVPFAALPIEGDLELTDFVSLVVMPTFAAPTAWPLRALREGAERSLVIGDPRLTQPDSIVKRGMFPPLPGARAEAMDVANALNVKPLLGADASQKTVLAQAPDSNLIYFATHGVADDENPNDRSYLVLSDGALTARKIARLGLRRAPIVVMSACQTGLGKAFASGVIGLAKAWKHAGASAVVMSLWSVYDEPTRDLMVEFTTRLRSGEAADVALQSAMRREKAKYGHPVYWAGFTVYGNAPADF
jgi:hypothetical protein